MLINENITLPSCWEHLLLGGSAVTHIFADGQKISLEKVITSDNTTSFSIRYHFSKTGQPIVNVANKFCESLQFILAQRVSWFYLEEVVGDNTNIWLKPSLRRASCNRGRAKPPIQLDDVLFDNEYQHYATSTDNILCSESQFWLLYASYLNFILEDVSEFDVNHLSGWINRLIEIEHQSLEAEMLTVSVAVESVVKKYSSTFTQTTRTTRENKKEKLKNSIKSLKAWHQGEKGALEDSFNRRLDGFLSSLSSNSPQALFNSLVDEGLLDKSLVVAWKTTRNKSAHGSIVNPNKVSYYIKMCNKVNLLLFHLNIPHLLIFLIIEYEGPFSDYSQERFPTTMFQKKINSVDVQL